MLCIMYYLLDPGTITFPISTYICLFNVRVYVQINYMAKQECKIIVICQYCLSVCNLTKKNFLSMIVWILLLQKNWSWCSNHAEFVVVLVCENLELSCSDYFCSLLATKSAAVGCVGVSGFKICILDDMQ